MSALGLSSRALSQETRLLYPRKLPRHSQTGVSALSQRYSCSLPSRARARLGGAMPTDLLDLLERCSGSWPHDSMVRSPAAPSPIPFS
jgi:hypothetical protein